MSADWPEGDVNNVSLPTIVSSSDLFDGELFGDELINIYNNEATGDNGDSNEINALLNGVRAKADESHLHPGAQMAMNAAGMDDGLGAFRPSTSFNDLSSLLTGEANTSSTAETNASGKATPTTETTSAKKRSADPNAQSPASKRRASTAKPAAKAASKSDTTSAASTKQDNTPNPLGLGQPSVTNRSAPPVSTKAVAEGSDFKSVAQAAVSNLILSAGSTKAEAGNKASAATDAKVDTSTAHIKALTGNNWVSACSGATTGIVPVSVATDSKNANRARRQNLTPDERARQNRDRNREHARNTRLRKKAYVEELKRTLTELVSQRDASDLEKRQTTQREAEQREVRFRVIEEFLKLRGRNEPNFARWAAILEDGFHLTIPGTPYRSTVSSPSASHEQVLNGVPEIMADATNFTEFLQGFKGESDNVIGVHYECDRKKFLMDGCNAVLEWTAKSTNKVPSGQFEISGLIRGHFSPASNKLISASITFDTGVVLSQLNNRGQQQAPAQDAAEAAASQAGALLDSVQVPQLSVSVPAAVTVVPPSSSSSSEASAADKDDSMSSDGSTSDRQKPAENGMKTRRVLRRST